MRVRLKLVLISSRTLRGVCQMGSVPNLLGLTYGGFSAWLQRLGLKPRSIRSWSDSEPIGKGTYFSVYRQQVRPVNYRALHLTIFIGDLPRISTPMSPLSGCLFATKPRRRLTIKDSCTPSAGRFRHSSTPRSVSMRVS